MTDARLLRGVTGVVRAANDGPVEGALVVPRSLDVPSPAVPEIAAFTGADGQYSWDLPPGRWQLTVSAEGYRTGTQLVTVTKHAPATLDFTLQPAD